MHDETTAPARPPSLRSLVVPAEHGAWGLVLEPLVLGLLVAPSVAGGMLGVAALLAFLARQPLRLAIADHLRGSGGPRAKRAASVAAVLSAGAALAFGISLTQSSGCFWLPLLCAAPLGLIQFAYDARFRGRALLPELLGATAPGALATAIAWAGGWGGAAAWWLWLLISLRAVPAVVYIRARLRLDRGVPTSRGPVWLSHALALAGVAVLAKLRSVPALAILPFALLLARALGGLAAGRSRVPPKVLGAAEVAYGAATVLALALGYATTNLE